MIWLNIRKWITHWCFEVLQAMVQDGSVDRSGEVPEKTSNKVFWKSDDQSWRFYRPRNIMACISEQRNQLFERYRDIYPAKRISQKTTNPTTKSEKTWRVSLDLRWDQKIAELFDIDLLLRQLMQSVNEWQARMNDRNRWEILYQVSKKLLKINKVQLHYIHCNCYLEYIEVIIIMMCRICTLISY